VCLIVCARPKSCTIPALTLGMAAIVAVVRVSQQPDCVRNCLTEAVTSLTQAAIATRSLEHGHRTENGGVKAPPEIDDAPAGAMLFISMETELAFIRTAGATLRRIPTGDEVGVLGAWLPVRSENAGLGDATTGLGPYTRIDVARVSRADGGPRQPQWMPKAAS